MFKCIQLTFAFQILSIFILSLSSVDFIITVISSLFVTKILSFNDIVASFCFYNWIQLVCLSILNISTTLYSSFLVYWKVLTSGKIHTQTICPYFTDVCTLNLFINKRCLYDDLQVPVFQIEVLNKYVQIFSAIRFSSGTVII